MSTHETSVVRVATMKDSGKRYLLEAFYGTRAMVWGELVSFKGLRSEHRGGLRWVQESLFTFKEEKKTVALCMALLKQAAGADPSLAVRIVANGAALAYLNDSGEEVRKQALEPVVRVVEQAIAKVDKADRHVILGSFLKVE